MSKTPGQIAYEQELEVAPEYWHGAKRKTWWQLSEVARDSWERDPTPRHPALRKTKQRERA